MTSLTRIRSWSSPATARYVLARDGRPYREGLARILDETAWDGETFTRVLRLRILRYLDDCMICDNGGT